MPRLNRTLNYYAAYGGGTSRVMEALSIPLPIPPEPQRIQESDVDVIPIMDVKKRNPLRGCFAQIVVKDDLDVVLKMFSTLGITITPENLKIIENIVENKPFRGVCESSTIFIGVNNKDVFVVCNDRYASNIGGLRIMKDVYSPKVIDEYPNSAFICETTEVAREFLTRSTMYGFKKANGEPLIDEHGNFEYPFGEDTCYDLQRCTVRPKSEVESSYVNVIYAQCAMYEMNKSLHRYRLPEGGLYPEQLVRGRLYQRMIINGDNQRVIVFKYNGNLESSQDIMDMYGDYCQNAFYIGTDSSRDYYMSATTENRRMYRESFRIMEDYIRRNREEERRRDEVERAKKLRDIKNNISTYNRDSQTQLLSESLHKTLTKALDNKVARCLLKLNSLGYLSGSTRNITIRKTDKEMTYNPAGKETLLTADGAWVAKGRQSGKYGKVIRKVLSEQVPRLRYTDYDIEQLVNHLKAESADGDFNTVSGDDILYWYDGDRYHEEVDLLGTLGCSCMRGEECQPFLKIYSDNPDVVKMIILTKDDHLIGRALLWNDKWMDRIYGTDSTIKAFKNYAKEKGYHCKASQNSCCDELWIDPVTGESYSQDIIIELKTDFEYYPYADTMCYIDVGGGKISNNSKGLNVFGEMRDTGGNLDGDDFVYDEYEDRQIHSDAAVFIADRDYYTHEDNAFCCDIDGEYHLQDDRVTTWDGRDVYEGNVVYINDTYAEEKDIYTCDHDGESYIEGLNPSVHLSELDLTVMEDNVLEAYEANDYHFVNNEWHSREDLEGNNYIEVDGEWSLSESDS